MHRMSIEKTGAISVPDRSTPSLVPYSAPGHMPTPGNLMNEKGPGVHEYHVVYTQPETLRYYKKRGRFPDGGGPRQGAPSVPRTMPMTTGPGCGGTARRSRGGSFWSGTPRAGTRTPPCGAMAGDGRFFNPGDDPNHTRHQKLQIGFVCRATCRLSNSHPRTAVEDDKWIYTLGKHRVPRGSEMTPSDS